MSRFTDIVSGFLGRESKDDSLNDFDKEVVFFINDEEKVAIITHDFPLLNLHNIAFHESGNKILIFSEEQPDGHLCQEPLSEQLIGFVKQAEEALYVNINSKTHDIIQEEYIPLKII